LVEPVVALLRTAPTDVFFDIDTIEPGEVWSQRLERALKGASLFVIFWCEHSANSVWVRKEWVFAVDKKKKVIPVLLDSTPLPIELVRFQWIDFRRFAQELHVSAIPAAPPDMAKAKAEHLVRLKHFSREIARPRSRRIAFTVISVLLVLGISTLAFLRLSLFGHIIFWIGTVLLILFGAGLVTVVLLRIYARRPPKAKIRRMAERISPEHEYSSTYRVMAGLLRERLREEA